MNLLIISLFLLPWQSQLWGDSSSCPTYRWIFSMLKVKKKGVNFWFIHCLHDAEWWSHAGEIACLHQKQFKLTRSMTSERMPWGTLMTSLCFPPPSPFVPTQVHKALHFRKAEPTGALLSTVCKLATWTHYLKRSENSFVEKNKWSKCSVWLAVAFRGSSTLFLYL